MEMLPIAHALVDDGCFEPVFFIARPVPTPHLDDLRQQGFRVIDPKASPEPESERDATASAAPDDASDEKRPRWSLKGFAVAMQSRRGLAFLWYLLDFWRQLQVAKAVLDDDEDVAGIVVVGDRHVGWETALIKIANNRGIPSLIVPYTLSAPRGAVEFRLRRPDPMRFQLDSWLDRQIGKLFPNWVYEYEGTLFTFSPLDVALAARFWGIMPDKPWTLGGGAAPRMAVESPHLRDMFLEQGVPADKMIVTGKPSVDQVYESIQEVEPGQVRAELGIPEGQRILLCSVPHLAEHGLVTWDEHWQETESLLSTLTQQKEAAVVLSLHPKSDPEAYQPWADRFGAILARRRIYQLLPVCDLFVSNYSGVVMQAIGNGKPTVVFDFLGMDFPYFDEEPGLVVIRQREKLAPVVERLLSDEAYYEQLANAQRQRADEWILLDGQSTRRVVDLLYQLIEDVSDSE
jgi:hypothetical protein